MGLRAVKIDTLGLAKELENAGIPRPQAEAQIQTTIKVIDMALEEKLATKHDITHALKHTEDKLFAEIKHTESKLLAEISKLQETDEKLSSKIEVIEEKLSNKIHKVDIKIDKLEEKLSTRMDKMEDKLSTEIAAGRKETQELKERVTSIENKMERLFSSVVLKMTGVAVFCTSAILGAILKFH
ncbi:MAG TPA: hypothetical protein VGV92_02990 [Gammaproteobacteria bacterium]|nr:hypothetical protein [Gammaproteobacteria bacterium]